MDKDCRPFHGDSTHEMAVERFSLPRVGDDAGFYVRPVGKLTDDMSISSLVPHSPLVQHNLTTVKPQRMRFLECTCDGNYSEPLPNAFSWAAGCGAKTVDQDKAYEARFIFADREEDGRVELNDFLVEKAGDCSSECEARSISHVLLEVIAHRRSLLFGLALANRFVNVMLPHALLTSVDAKGGCWILQPVVSLIRVKHGGGGPFRPMYSLTLILIPVGNSRCGAREMPECEIEGMVNAGWSLASSPRPTKLSRFEVAGLLPNYLSRLARFDLSRLLFLPGDSRKRSGASVEGKCPSLTLRQATEVIAFAVALGVVQGSAGRADCQAKRRIGKDVVTSLGNARVSSVVVVDPNLTEKHLTEPKPGADPPGALRRLTKTLAPETRVPLDWDIAQQRKYRLDHPFVDNDTYAVGVLPRSRCLVITSAGCAQRGRVESGLMQAGWVAYMTIGAATAIGTMRAIDRDLEQMEDSDPRKIAKIEGEIAVDLHEIYDLDITREAYRHLYRLLRNRLGITRDYQTLQDKMKALDRETTTRYEAKAQARLAWLTAAIVVLSALILIGTIVAASK